MDIVLLKDKIRVDTGGASFSAHLLAEELTNRGHNVRVVTVHFTGVSNNLPQNYSYTVTESPVQNYTQVDGALRVYHVIDELDDPDLIHSFQPQLNPVLGAWARSSAGTATVGRLNSYQNFCTNPALMDNGCFNDCTVRKKWEHHPEPSLGSLPKMGFDTFLQPHLMNNLDALFAISPAVADIFEGFGVDRSRLKIVPNFYEEGFGSFVPDQSLGEFTDQKYRIVYVGRLVRKKGVHLLIDAIEEADVDVEVDIIGDGEELEQLRQRAPKNVTVHGRIDHADLPEYYQQADVFVHPGLWLEPFGRTILEAMQCGCVPVVSDVGGPPWIVGEAGMTFPRGKSSGLAAELEVVAHPNKWEAHREAIPRELDRFEPESVLDKLIDEYKRII